MIANDKQQQSRVWYVKRSGRPEYKSEDSASVLDNTPPSTGELQGRAERDGHCREREKERASERERERERRREAYMRQEACKGMGGPCYRDGEITSCASLSLT